jgi:hypothetical protein
MQLENQKNKQELLQTRINELWISDMVITWFNQYSPCLTLGEFFALNHEFLFDDDKFIVGREGERGFGMKSSTWELFRRYLIQKGFTHNDFIMLLHRVDGEYLFESLNKEALKKIPFQKIGHLRSKSETFQIVSKLFTGKFSDELTDNEQRQAERVSVGKLLEISRDDIYGVFFYRDKLNNIVSITRNQAHVIMTSLDRIQLKLKQYHLTSEDGPFMDICFSRMKFKVHPTGKRDKRVPMERIKYFPGSQGILDFTGGRPESLLNNVPYDSNSTTLVSLNEKLLGP